MPKKRKTVKRAYVRKKPYRKPENVGRPAHVPTIQTRAVVKMAVALGKTRKQICEYLEIVDSTLHVYYADEIRRAKFEIDMLVGQSAVQQATGGALTMDAQGKSLGSWKEAVPAMTKLYLTTRLEGAFKEAPQEHRHSGAIGSYDLTKLSDEELDRIEATLARATVEEPADEPE
jgi:hypothetical protein